MPDISLNRKKDGSLVLKMDDKLFHFRTQEAFNKFASNVVNSWHADGGQSPFIYLGESAVKLKPEDNLMLMALIASQVLHPSEVESGVTPENINGADPYQSLLQHVWSEFSPDTLD